MLYFNYPFSFYGIKLFESDLYAYSNNIPSLGDLFIIVIIIFYIVFLIHRFVEYENPSKVSFKNYKVLEFESYLTNLLEQPHEYHSRLDPRLHRSVR